MGDGDDSPSYGYAGIDGVYGPFETRDKAEAFIKRAESAKPFAIDFSVYELTMKLPSHIEQNIPKRYRLSLKDYYERLLYSRRASGSR